MAAEGAPNVSVGQAEIILRRMGKHLLEVAEKLSLPGEAQIALEGEAGLLERSSGTFNIAHADHAAIATGI